ncbi:virulence factor BrkB family protein [Motilimonas sp. KMU-193]|uniref:virulence factor BrkB family protein n=1 Tax=Motilimonas sp. KMU-193 TaxID=3388668 RepID=UPI00396B07C2
MSTGKQHYQQQLMALGRHALAFAIHVYHRASEDRVKVTAGYLAYVTLLSLVPMLAVVFAVMSAFPVFQELQVVIEDFVYANFVPAAGEALRENLTGFIANTNKMTAMGVGALMVVALMLISAIDQNLNHIWRVKKKRNLASAFAMYWMVLTLGPVIAGASIAMSSYVVSMNFISDPDLITHGQKMLALLPLAISTLMFLGVYTLVPNTRVKIRHAIVGAIVAAILFELSKKGFAFYITQFPSYQAIYGALATIPILFVWVYLSWIIVLVGAELTAALGDYPGLAILQQADNQQQGLVSSPEDQEE